MAVQPGMTLSLLQTKALAIENQLTNLIEIFRAAGIAPSQEQTARVPNYGNQFLTSSADEVAPGGSFPVKRVTATFEDVEIPKIGIDVPAPWEDLTPSMQALNDEAYSAAAIHDVLIAANVGIAAEMLNGGNWTSSANIDFTGTGNPLVEIYNQMQVVSDLLGGWWPNRLVLAKSRFSQLVTHASSLERLNPTNPLTMQKELVAAILDLPSDGVVIVDVHNDGGPVFDADSLWIARINTTGMVSLQPSALVTPRWMAAGGSDLQPYRLRREYVFKGSDAGVDGDGEGSGDDVWIYRAETFLKAYVALADAASLLTAVDEEELQ